MFTLALIGLLGGLITGISPCILPVLPVIFFSGGAQSARRRSKGADGAAAGDTVTAQVAPGEQPEVSRWRPYLVILGLVISFSLATLLGSLLLNLLGLPQDVLRWAGIVVLLLIGTGLIVPRFQHLLEKPFSRIPQRAVGTDRSGIGLGLALGVVYVPCAGPVLAAIAVAGSTGRIGVETVVLTLSFAIGAAVPLLVFALAGRRVAERVAAFRSRQRAIRATGGALMIALAIGLVFNVPQLLQRLVPDYTAGVQEQLAQSDEVKDALDLGGLVTDENRELDNCSNGSATAERCGTAPSLKGIDSWLNTPDGEGISLDELHGKVVLVDFWAYSCINCQRSLPHITAWDKAYEDAGLQVIGVHSPEYAFEKEPRNVAAAARDFGIDYPVAIDNELATWTNYRNRYWPARYLIDADGTVRQIMLGEGRYEQTEDIIRELLTDANPDVTLPERTGVADTTPKSGSTTPETFLGTTKEVNFAGEERYSGATESFSLPKQQPDDSFALDGDWSLGTQSITPGSDGAAIRLNYTASEVRVVLSGQGTVTATIDGKQQRIEVSGTPRSYELRKGDARSGQITLEPGDGVEAYSFTFG